MDATKPRKPQQGRRRTTLSLTHELWARLCEIEDHTGAPPSVTVRRVLEQGLKKYPPSTPAA